MQSAFAITLFHCLSNHGPFFAQKRSACSLELFCEFRSERGAELHAASLLVAGGFG